MRRVRKKNRDINGKSLIRFRLSVSSRQFINFPLEELIS